MQYYFVKVIWSLTYKTTLASVFIVLKVDNYLLVYIIELAYEFAVNKLLMRIPTTLLYDTLITDGQQ